MKYAKYFLKQFSGDTKFAKKVAANAAALAYEEGDVEGFEQEVELVQNIEVIEENGLSL